MTASIFRPVGMLIAAIAVPIVGAGLIFYVTNPLVNLLERYKIKRVYSIIIVFLLMIALGFFSVYFIIPPIQDQFIRLAETFPQIIEWFEELLAFGKIDKITFLQQLMKPFNHLLIISMFMLKSLLDHYLALSVHLSALSYLLL